MEAVREAAVSDGMIVLAILHDLNLALRWADTVVLLAQGVVTASGPPAEAVTPETLAGAYGITARVERCSLRRPLVLVDGKTNEDGQTRSQGTLPSTANP
jgi:iron complex transport system ATP-binding protein